MPPHLAEARSSKAKAVSFTPEKAALKPLKATKCSRTCGYDCRIIITLVIIMCDLCAIVMSWSFCMLLWNTSWFMYDFGTLGCCEANWDVIFSARNDTVNSWSGNSHLTAYVSENLRFDWMVFNKPHLLEVPQAIWKCILQAPAPRVVQAWWGQWGCWWWWCCGGHADDGDDAGWWTLSFLGGWCCWQVWGQMALQSPTTYNLDFNLCLSRWLSFILSPTG